MSLQRSSFFFWKFELNYFRWTARPSIIWRWLTSAGVTRSVLVSLTSDETLCVRALWSSAGRTTTTSPWRRSPGSASSWRVSINLEEYYQHVTFSVSRPHQQGEPLWASLHPGWGCGHLHLCVSQCQRPQQLQVREAAGGVKWYSGLTATLVKTDQMKYENWPRWNI